MKRSSLQFVFFSRSVRELCTKYNVLLIADEVTLLKICGKLESFWDQKNVFVFIKRTNLTQILPERKFSLTFLLVKYSSLLVTGGSRIRVRIYSCARPFYERAVSNRDRSTHRSLWVYVTYSSFIEGSHMTKNVASDLIWTWFAQSCLYLFN
jgi:hypothetical protein